MFKLKFAALACAAAILVAGIATPAKAQSKDIVDTAVAAGSFQTLAKALTEAGLIDTLKSAGPFTVFAPTDEAFAKVPKAQLDALLKDKAALIKVLTYHVVKGKVPASEVVKLNGKAVGTVEGSTVKVKIDGGKVMVNNANVVKTDIMTSNGVIHVIDTVILPDLKK
ncbi:MAG: fasciclin domain-containing protein [Blastocatellia bacterium]|nr:fasciclin domain-containing protein [Blastocatellia bacterium]